MGASASSRSAVAARESLILLTHPRDRAQRSALRTIGSVAIVALLHVAALSPAACSSRAERPVTTAAAASAGAGARGSDGPPGATAGDWPGWQKDLRGTRYNAAETEITPSTVAGLKLRWSFVFPEEKDSAPASQPAVVGHTLYVGSGDGR